MGGQTQTGTSMQFQSVDRNPWSPAWPALNTALGGAMDAYNNTYRGPLVAEMDPNVTAGQDALINQARAGGMTNAANTALGQYRNVLANGGMTAYHRQGANAASQGMGLLSGVARNLNPFATGQYLKEGGNPYLDRALGSAMSDAADGVNAQFSAAGRYGSGAQTDALARRLGSIQTDARMADYNNQVQNMLSANQQLQGVSSGMGGLGGVLASIGQQGVGNLSGAGAALQSLGDARTADASQLARIGGQRMDYRQRLIDAQNEAPWTRVGNLAGIAQGIGSMGGTTTGWSYGKQEQSGGGGGLMGGILSGLGAGTNLLKSLGGLGGFAGLFSDERLKEDVKKVGELDDGQKVYAYRYKGDPRMQIGLLAQEVEKKKPKAVRTHRSGYKMVDYEKAVA